MEKSKKNGVSETQKPLRHFLSRNRRFFVIGALPVLVIGFLIWAIVLHDKTRIYTYDRDQDGVAEERQYFKRGRVLKKLFDTNADGRDDVYAFYQDGICVRIEYDTNFDGKTDFWEDRYDEQILRSKASLEFDDRINFWQYFENNQIAKEETDSNSDGVVDRRILYSNGKPVKSEIDKDYDGVMDESNDLTESEPDALSKEFSLVVNIADDDFAEDTPLTFEVVLKNVSEKDWKLVVPYTDFAHRAAKVYLKKDGTEKFIEYNIGPKNYALESDYIFAGDSQIGSEWSIKLKEVTGLFQGPGRYLLYAEYKIDDTQHSGEGVWKGHVRSETYQFNVKMKPADKWIADFTAAVAGKEPRIELETKYTDFSDADKRYIVSILWGSDSEEIKDFALFKRAEMKDYTIAPLLIERLNSEDVDLRLKSLEFLKELTGQEDDFEVDWRLDFPKVRKAGIQKWRQWWQEHRETFMAPKEPPLESLVSN